MVTCLLCNKPFKRLTRSHLVNEHGLSTQEYKLRFPEAETIDTELRHAYGKNFRDANPMKLDKYKKIISDQRIGIQFSEEHRKKISESRLGKSNGPHTKETKDKISESNKKTSKIKKLSGYIRPKYSMSEDALLRARNRMLGNKIGAHSNHNKGKKLNLTQAQRAHRSQKRVEYLSLNKGVRSGTKPEMKFIEYLNSLHIPFDHQFPLITPRGSWLYDFYIPSMNLLVEIDGEFWHSRPLSVNRDKIKNKIAKEHKLTVARISDSNLSFDIIFENHNMIWKKNWELILKRENND